MTVRLGTRVREEKKLSSSVDFDFNFRKNTLYKVFWERLSRQQVVVVDGGAGSAQLSSALLLTSQFALEKLVVACCLEKIIFLSSTSLSSAFYYFPVSYGGHIELCYTKVESS